MRLVADVFFARHLRNLQDRGNSIRQLEHFQECSCAAFRSSSRLL